MYFPQVKNLSFLLLSLSLWSCQNDLAPEEMECTDRSFPPDSSIERYQANQGALLDLDFDKKIAPEYLQSDYQILSLMLKEANPNLYRYRSQSAMDSFFDAQICALSDSAYYLEFIRSLAKTFNFMACGHSGWSHRNSYFPYRDSSLKLLPLDLKIEGNQYFIQENFSENPILAKGMEIIKINGRSPSEINHLLSQHMYKDGQSAPEARQEIEKYFRNAYSNFIENPEHFEIQVRHPKGLQELYLNALAKGEIDSIQKAREPISSKPSKFLEFQSWPSKNMAYYRIGWFRNEGIEAMGQNFNHFTDSIFAAIAMEGLDTLIIDLRGNTGGWTANGKKLLSYLLNEPHSYIDDVRFKKLGNFSFQELILSDQGLNDTMQFTLGSDSLWTWTNYPSLEVQPAESNSFQGQVIILIDEWTRSAAGIFSSLAREYSNALFIGPENACARGGQGGMVMVAQLPWTGVTVHFSTAKYNLSIDPQKVARGINSDYANLEQWTRLHPQSSLAEIWKAEVGDSMIH
ncbi:S41 family peptidase [Croceimicrobium sp.]|uniref:S41 family peptidase n=1 Tax=Croceimicrobium sp. TaxID=2828340 RepID=UPI003BACEEA6